MRAAPGFLQGFTVKLGRRILLWVLAPLAAFVLIVCGVVLALFLTFYPSPPEADFPAAADVATAQRQDFDYFKHYFELNRTYTPRARDSAAQMLAQYRARSGSFTPAQFDLAIASVTAPADNGHSRVHPSWLARRHNRMPCRLYRFDDGYYIVRARGVCTDLLGAKLLSVDGRPIEAAVDHMFRYFGGPRNHYDQFAAPFFLESPELLHAAELTPAEDRSTWTLLLRDSSTRDVEIPADAADETAPRTQGQEFLSPERIEGEPEDWRPLLAPDAQLPLFLADFRKPFNDEYWGDESTYYVQFNSNADEPGYPIGEFVSRVRETIVRYRPRYIVLDLRFDQGGNFTTTASLMKSLTRLTDSVEHIYVLTSAWTFSAGIVSLALAKEHAGDKLTTIGALVGDRTRIWAEGGTLTLPNSELRVGFATGLHDYTDSCFGEPGCFWVMYFFPTHIKTLQPNVPVSYTFRDYVELRDPVLERARELIGGAQPSTMSRAQLAAMM